MSEELNFTVTENEKNIRIDKAVTLFTDRFSRNAVANFITNGNLLVNGVSVSKNYKVKIGDEIDVCVPDPVMLTLKPQNIPLDIVYEDDDLLVVNKPKGMVVHPAPGNYDGTLVNALLYHCGVQNLSTVNLEFRPGIVHRIDKDTSGLLIVAKTNFAHISLAEQIKEHSFNRCYEAVAYGKFKEDEGTIDLPIGRDKNDRKKMAVTNVNSRNAVTHFTVKERFDHFTYLRLKLETGRTHQIRVHLANRGNAVAGDAVYGPKKVITSLNGQCLHAKMIGFVHPRTNEYMEFESELPEYFSNFLDKLKKTDRR